MLIMHVPFASGQCTEFNGQAAGFSKKPSVGNQEYPGQVVPLGNSFQGYAKGWRWYGIHN
jgi:hypothetical protein